MMRITRYGQSGMLLDEAGTRLLIDPGTFCGSAVFELGELDAILFTHEHVDHCDPERVPGLLAANPAALVYAPAAVLEQLGLAAGGAVAGPGAGGDGGAGDRRSGNAGGNADGGAGDGAGGRGRAVIAGRAFTVGQFRVEPVGELHQVILPEIARCANTGFVVTDTAGTKLFHPGDSYEAIPAGIDVLAVPLLGPWSSLRETVEFVKAVSPAQIFAMHDALLNESGRALFWRLLTTAVGPQVAHLPVEIGD
ncbi:MBL fold metallo-hydrolase [Leucobacter sp. HY1908]